MCEHRRVGERVPDKIWVMEAVQQRMTRNRNVTRVPLGIVLWCEFVSNGKVCEPAAGPGRSCSQRAVPARVGGDTPAGGHGHPGAWARARGLWGQFRERIRASVGRSGTVQVASPVRVGVRGSEANLSWSTRLLVAASDRGTMVGTVRIMAGR